MLSTATKTTVSQKRKIEKPFPRETKNNRTEVLDPGWGILGRVKPV